MSTCAYCGQDTFENNRCLGCGARLKRVHDPLVREDMRMEPFAYNGYIIWPLRKYDEDTIEFQFWRGESHVESIKFTWELWRNLRPEYL